MTCSHCGAAVPPDARFCGQCGAPVAGAPPAAGGFAPPHGTPLPATPAPAPVPAPAPATAAAPTESGLGRPAVPPANSSASRRWLLAGCGVLAAGLVAAVVWMLVRSDDSAAGGASSPEGVASGFADAMSGEDLLAAATFVAPSESPGLDQLLVTLRDAAKAQGISGLSAGDGLDVELDMTAERVTELADGIARVEVRMDMSLTGSPAGPVGALLPADGVDVDDRDLADALDADELTMIVVEESGRWYVSPMLTIGEYAAEALDLPGPRWDEAAEPADERTASSEEAAFEQLAEAVEERDPQLAAGVLAPGEARFVRVFGRAIDELLGRWDGDVSVDDLEVSEVSDGRWAVEHVEVVARGEDEFDVSGIQVDDGCLLSLDELDSGTLCLDELDWLSEPLDDEQLIVRTSRDGDAARLGLAATVIDDLGQLATRVSRSTLLEALGLQLLDVPVTATVDEPLILPFAGEHYQVVEWIGAEDRSYLVEPIEGDVGFSLDLYASTPDGGWEWIDWTWSSPSVLDAMPAGTRFRAVVTVDSDCDDDGERCEPQTGDVELVVRRLPTIEAEVGTLVKPLLGPGRSVVLEVPADAEHRYEVTSDTDGVLLRSVEYNSVYDLSLDEDGYVAAPYDGPLRILVTNTDDAEVRAEVALREHDLATTGELPDGDGVTLDFSGGEATYELDVAGATSVTVTVVPDGLQDVVLDIAECADCLTDIGYAGESETTTMALDGEVTITVVVSAYSTVDAFGSVVLYVEDD